MKILILLSLSLFSFVLYGGQCEFTTLDNEISQDKILLSSNTITYRKRPVFCKNQIKVVVYVDTTLIKAIEKKPGNLRLHLTDLEGNPFSIRTTRHWCHRDGRRREKPFTTHPSIKILNKEKGKIKISFPTKIKTYTKYSGRSMRYDFESNIYQFYISFDMPGYTKITSESGMLRVKGLFVTNAH